MIDAIYTSISEYLSESDNNLVKNKKLIKTSFLNVDIQMIE